jgi:hypothetical protein
MSIDLGKQGRAIWDAYGAAKLPSGAQQLVIELARCADTCDRLDGLAAGRQETWASLVFDDMGEIHLSIDKVLELRLKHQLAYKTLIAEVRAANILPVADQTASKDEGPKDMLAELRKQKEDRERKSG